jgi:ABC-2 type transport system ATP-binding protein
MGGYMENSDHIYSSADFEKAAQNDTHASDSGIILTCKNLSKSYGETVALDGVNFEIPKGKIIGLLGPNGSGKTTFIKIAAGLLTESAGSVCVLGNAIGAATKSLVAYLPERNSIPEHFTVGEAVNFYEDFFSDFDRAKAESMLSALRVEKSYKIKTLSKGTKEKVSLIIAMSRDAKLYLLDEPIAGVDPAARDYVIKMIMNNYSPKSTVIISTHLISDVEQILSDFVFIHNGQIVMEGNVDEIRNKEQKSIDQLFREVFRC